MSLSAAVRGASDLDMANMAPRDRRYVRAVRMIHLFQVQRSKTLELSRDNYKAGEEWARRTINPNMFMRIISQVIDWGAKVLAVKAALVVPFLPKTAKHLVDRTAASITNWLWDSYVSGDARSVYGVSLYRRTETGISWDPGVDRSAFACKLSADLIETGVSCLGPALDDMKKFISPPGAGAMGAIPMTLMKAFVGFIELSAKELATSLRAKHVVVRKYLHEEKAPPKLYEQVLEVVEMATGKGVAAVSALEPLKEIEGYLKILGFSLSDYLKELHKKLIANLRMDLDGDEKTQSEGVLAIMGQTLIEQLDTARDSAKLSKLSMSLDRIATLVADKIKEVDKDLLRQLHHLAESHGVVGIADDLTDALGGPIAVVKDLCKEHIDKAAVNAKRAEKLQGLKINDYMNSLEGLGILPKGTPRVTMASVNQPGQMQQYFTSSIALLQQSLSQYAESTERLYVDGIRSGSRVDVWNEVRSLILEADAYRTSYRRLFTTNSGHVLKSSVLMKLAFKGEMEGTVPYSTENAAVAKEEFALMFLLLHAQDKEGKVSAQVERQINDLAAATTAKLK